MKKVIYTGFVLMVAACSTREAKQENAKFMEQQNAIFRKVGYTINHGKCYETGIDITPIVNLDKNVVIEGEFITGKAYYPTTYFSKLAKCYSFKYKTTLTIIGDNAITNYTDNSANQDTVRFSVSPDSLAIVKQNGAIAEYQLRVKLRAAFSDKSSGYDTTGGAATATVIVRKKARK